MVVTADLAALLALQRHELVDVAAELGLRDLLLIVLGEHLPEGVGKALATGIEAHLTPYGLATELPTPRELENLRLVADGLSHSEIAAPL